MNKHPIIRKIYLYLFTLVGLALITIGGVRLVGLGLKTFIFTKADVYYEYPMARPIKAPPIEENQKTMEFEQPSKEEVEEYQRKQKSSNRQREAADSLAMIIVGLPLYLYHWRLIKKDKEENETKY